jgi:hypothetical protein
MGLVLIRYGNLARESFRAPVEAHVAIRLAANDALHHSRSETLSRGRIDGWTTGLGPAQDERFVFPARPLYVNVPIGNRQGPELSRVGS